MALFVDGALRVVFPDRVLMLEPATGRGIMSVELAVGLDVVLLGAPAHPLLREAATGSDQGRAAFSPARYGRPDLDFRPIEELAGTTEPSG
jgi:DUF917 family protein